MPGPVRRRPAVPPGLMLPPIGRRSFVRGALAGGLGLTVPGLLSACGTDPAVQSADTCRSTDSSATDKSLVWSNWPGYIDKGKQTLLDFSDETDIEVSYTPDINDNNEFFAKIQNQLGDCEPIGRDIIVLTDWMAARLVKLGWLQQLDHGNLANVHANLSPSLQGPDWDPKRDYSVPWQSGFTGIAYNAKYTGEVRSMSELLTRPDLKGKVSLLLEMRDTMGFMLVVNGSDPASFDDQDWSDALATLEESVDSGQVRRFTGNDYVGDLDKGDLVACEAWSGDVIGMQAANPDIKWLVPEEGLMLWSDNMLVPNKADHKANAEKAMDYYYEPEVAARLAAWVNYICPVDGARQAMEKIDPTLVDAPLIFPDEEILAQTHQFMALDDATAKTYDTDFSQAVG